MGWTHPNRPSGVASRMAAPTLHALARALGALRGEAEARRILTLSGVPVAWDAPPRDAASEADFLLLLRFLSGTLSRPDALEVARQAGQEAGQWFIRARIPVPARFMLQSMPGRIAYPLLLRTLEVHGWTLVGGGSLAPDPDHERGLRLLHGAAARAFPEPGLLHAYYVAALHPVFTFFLGPDLRIVTRDALPPREGIALNLEIGAGVRP